jgi:hypothetical protein
MIVKIRTADFTGNYVRKAALIIALAVSLLSMGHCLFYNTGCAHAEWSKKDARRVKEIIKKTMLQPDYLTPSIHAEFWRILGKGNFSSADIVHMRRTMTGVLTEYQPLFWNDAKISLKTGRPYKSDQRHNLETELLKNRIISKGRVGKNQALMNKIAKREPLSRNGVKFVVDTKVIDTTLGRLGSVAGAINRLFSAAQQ